MRFHRTVMPALAMIVLTGCIHTKKLDVWATKVQREDGTWRIVIDKSESKHDSVVVQPGDRIAWVCHCPEGAEFRIENLHYVANLEELVEKLRETPAPLAAEDLDLTMERMRAQLAGRQVTAAADAAAPGQPETTPPSLAEGRIHFEAIGDVLLVVKYDLTAAAPGERSRGLFVERGQRGGKRFTDADDGASAVPPFTGATKRLRSTRVARTPEKLALWKFTWRVQLKGIDNSADTFDPHIVEHPDLKGS